MSLVNYYRYYQKLAPRDEERSPSGQGRGLPVGVDASPTREVTFLHQYQWLSVEPRSTPREEGLERRSGRRGSVLMSISVIFRRGRYSLGKTDGFWCGLHNTAEGAERGDRRQKEGHVPPLG